MVGDEDMTGIAWFMGGDSTPSRVLTPCAGQAFQPKAKLSLVTPPVGGVSEPV